MITGGNGPGGCGPFSGGSPTALQNAGINFPVDAAGCFSTQSYLTWTGSPNIGAEFVSGIVTLTGCPQGIALPIKMSDFKVEEFGASNRIIWTTETEINNEWQILERSYNGDDDWIEIDKIAGSVSSTSAKTYEVLDDKPLINSYYRIRSIDLDGSEGISDVISLRRNATVTAFKIINSIVDDYISVDGSISDDVQLQYSIMNTNGVTICEGKEKMGNKQSNIKIDVTHINSGHYFIKLILGASHEIFSFIKK
jgi:hypothetical protein